MGRYDALGIRADIPGCVFDDGRWTGSEARRNCDNGRRGAQVRGEGADGHSALPFMIAGTRSPNKKKKKEINASCNKSFMSTLRNSM